MTRRRQKAFRSLHSQLEKDVRRLTQPAAVERRCGRDLSLRDGRGEELVFPLAVRLLWTMRALLLQAMARRVLASLHYAYLVLYVAVVYLNTLHLFLLTMFISC